MCIVYRCLFSACKRTAPEPELPEGYVSPFHGFVWRGLASDYVVFCVWLLMLLAPPVTLCHLPPDPAIPGGCPHKPMGAQEIPGRPRRGGARPHRPGEPTEEPEGPGRPREEPGGPGRRREEPGKTGGAGRSQAMGPFKKTF